MRDHLELEGIGNQAMDERSGQAIAFGTVVSYLDSHTKEVTSHPHDACVTCCVQSEVRAG